MNIPMFLSLVSINHHKIPLYNNYIVPICSHYIYTYMCGCQNSFHETDINIIWKGHIPNHSFVAILPSLYHIDLQGYR